MSLKTSNYQANDSALPWYRFGIVWMVICLPLLVVIASMFTIMIAHKNAPVLIDQTPVKQQISKQ